MYYIGLFIINLSHSTCTAVIFQWNNHGYDVAKLRGGKFTHISPVWLQVKWGIDGNLVTQGEHDIDQGWLRDVRNAGASAGVKSMSNTSSEKFVCPNFLSVLGSECFLAVFVFIPVGQQ